MRTITLTALLLTACGSSTQETVDAGDTEEVISCGDTQVTPAAGECRISTEGLRIDDQFQCVVVWDENHLGHNAECISTELGFVTLKRSYILGAMRGVLVEFDDVSDFDACVFRGCEQ